MDKLVMMGHSFGGITALESSRKFEEIKYCVSFDPWLITLNDKLIDGDSYHLEQPLCMISTSIFHVKKIPFMMFDSFGTLRRLFANCVKYTQNEEAKAKNISLQINNSDHCD